jgi:hypothetical protein
MGFLPLFGQPHHRSGTPKVIVISAARVVPKNKDHVLLLSNNVALRIPLPPFHETMRDLTETELDLVSGGQTNSATATLINPNPNGPYQT